MAGYAYRGTIHDVTKEARPPRPTQPGFDPSACGTYAGYRRHQAHGTTICDDCRAAMNAYSRARYQPSPRKTFKPDACGTWKGWHRHKYHDVPPCDACRVAAREYQRAYRAQRKANA